MIAVVARVPSRLQAEELPQPPLALCLDAPHHPGQGPLLPATTQLAMHPLVLW